MSEVAVHDRPMTVAGALAALAVLVDAVLVGAPGLALLAVPMLIGLWLRHRPAGRIVMILGGLLITVIAAMYATSNGGIGDWPAGDVVGMLLGGPAAAISAALGIAKAARRHDGGTAHAH